MGTIALRWQVGGVSAVVCGCLAWLAVSSTHGQVKTEAAKGKGTSNKLYFGVSACTRCHTEMPKEHAKVFEKLGLASLCRCDEYPKWATDDKHGMAYKALLTPRGQVMGKALGYDVTKSKDCLSCHGVVIESEDQKDELFDLADGVSCVVCHGPDRRWVPKHGSDIALDRREWRKLTREYKHDQYGMTDLWDPIKRANLCASCHVGTLEGPIRKFVTHDMYAAGHPPLPAFEAATFSREMPNHWELFRDKAKRVSKEFVKKEFNVDADEPEETKMLLVSAVVSFAQSMRLLRDEAKEALNPKASGDGAMDLAHYDCYSCHHDLKSPSWRQTSPRASGKPGRVPMRSWPTALLDLSLAQAATVKETAKDVAALRSELKELQKAFDATPFGRPAAIQDTATKLITHADAIAGALAKAPLARAGAQSLLGRLPQLYQSQVLDYDSARQVAWAYRVIANELGTANNDVADQAFKGLLRLDLPSGRKRWITDELRERMEVLYLYTPNEFGKRLGGLPKPPGK